MDFVDFLQEWLYNIALAVLPMVGAFVIAYLKALIEKKIAEIEELKPELADAIRQAVSLAVKAAEQAGAAGLIENKKEYALTIAQKWLDNEGWDEFDIDILEAAIEAEVKAVFNRAGSEAEPARLWSNNAW